MQNFVFFCATLLLFGICIDRVECRKGPANKVGLGSFRFSNVKKSRIVPPLSGPAKSEEKLAQINEWKVQSKVNSDLRARQIEAGRQKRDNKRAKKALSAGANITGDGKDNISMDMDADVKINKEKGLRRLLLTKSLRIKRKSKL